MSNNIEEDLKKLQCCIDAIGEEYYVEPEKQILNNLIQAYKELEKENESLKLFILNNPNMNPEHAIAYMNLRRDAYIEGKAEEQERAKYYINENYISKSLVKERIELLNDIHSSYSQKVIYSKTSTFTELAQEILKELLETEENSRCAKR